AYRWFLGLSLTDKVPDASTFSQNRRRRFADSDIEQVIFDRIVEQAMAHGLIGGKALYTDSTHLKASANKRRHTVHEVTITPMAYLDELNAAIDADRDIHGKPPLKPSRDTKNTKPTKVSDTDPDAGYMVRDQKPEGFFYLDHRTVDGQHGLITDTYATPGNINDARPYLDRLDRQRERFNLTPGRVGLDAGYNTATICHGLIERGIEGVVGYKRPHGPCDTLPIICKRIVERLIECVDGFKSPHGQRVTMRKPQFTLDWRQSANGCLKAPWLTYVSTNANGYRLNKSDKETCRH